MPKELYKQLLILVKTKLLLKMNCFRSMSQNIVYIDKNYLCYIFVFVDNQFMDSDAMYIADMLHVCMSKS